MGSEPIARLDFLNGALSSEMSSFYAPQAACLLIKEIINFCISKKNGVIHKGRGGVNL